MNAALVSTIGELRKLSPEQLVTRITEGFLIVYQHLFHLFHLIVTIYQ